MAVAGRGSKGATFPEEKAESLTVLHGRFPEIPVDVVSGILQKNEGNMSGCIEELEEASPLYMYGDFVSSELPPPHTMIHTGLSGTNNNQSVVHSQNPDRGNSPLPFTDLKLILGEVDPDKTPQPSFTSWASLETGVPDDNTPTSSLQNPLNFYEEPKHVSLVTVDIKKPNERTVNASAMPRPSEGEAHSMQYGIPLGRTSNGFEPIVKPQNNPFEPRPLPPDNPMPWHVPEMSKSEEGACSQWTVVHNIQPAELLVTSQIASSYQIDPPRPSSPAIRPIGSRSPSSISLNAESPKTSKKSSIEEDATPFAGPGFSGVDPRLQDARRTSRHKNKRNLIPPQPGRSLSKEKEDEAYTEALLMHQKARFERLCKELEEERGNLNNMKAQTANMEREVADKHSHRSPFPKPGEISRLREQKRQLQIDIECMNREIDLHKSQGLMDLTQANSFYGNMFSTGPLGPVPPISPISTPIPENASPLSPTYDPPEENQMWSCSACTLLNHPALDKCECCEMPRDK